MKNKFKYIIITFATVVCGSVISCDSFLDENPKGALTPVTFLTNKEEVSLALNKINDDCVSDAGFNNHLGTDVGITGRTLTAAAHKLGMYDFLVDNTQTATGWTNGYATIKNCNFFLASIAKSTVLSDDVKGNALAQLLFFRAHSYLQLVIQYGDVPYWRDELVDVEKISLLGKTDQKVIINEMISDLDGAISSGNLSSARWNLNEGRPTVWAARMLKAYCHVWLAQYDQSHWAKARTELIEVTTNSPHGPNLGPYADMYRGGNEFHNEIIFGKQFLANVKGSIINSVSRPNTASENANSRLAFAALKVENGSAPYTLTKSFAKTFATADVRKLYNVWESAKFVKTGETTETTATFNYIYIPKFLRASVPVSDPLLSVAEATNQASAPARLFVLSDAYLLLAEAELMINGSTAAALAAINKVRTRANLPNLTVLTLKNIQNERAWELLGEGYWGRKRDLVRWGILESTVIALPAVELAAGATLTSQFYLRAKAQADIINAAPMGRYRVYPIPLTEIKKSQEIGGTLTQNPVWQ